MKNHPIYVQGLLDGNDLSGERAEEYDGHQKQVEEDI